MHTLMGSRELDAESVDMKGGLKRGDTGDINHEDEQGSVNPCRYGSVRHLCLT